MGDALTSLLAFVVAISVLVAVHEFGHYIVGRWMGMKVLRFSIGFGKPLLTWVRGADVRRGRVKAFGRGSRLDRFVDKARHVLLTLESRLLTDLIDEVGAQPPRSLRK